MLILAATPIGNLSDASPRLREALENTRYIAAEDTRNTLHLAHALGLKIEAKLFSLHEHNEADRIEQILEIAATNDVLVVSDAGMPTVSDPGFQLVRAAISREIEVTVIPGPSAVISALAVSGLATDRFTFEGFVPRKQGERERFFQEIKGESRTMIMFESPHRILECVEAAHKVLGNRNASVSRELTKKFEQTVRGSLEELIEWAQTEPKGEMVLVIAGAEPIAHEPQALVAQVNQLVSESMPLKAAVAVIAGGAGVSKSELYQLVLDYRQKTRTT